MVEPLALTLPSNGRDVGALSAYIQDYSEPKMVDLNMNLGMNLSLELKMSLELNRNEDEKLHKI